MTYLDLQQVIAADALVVHLVIRVIGIAARLVFHEGEAAGRLEPGSRRRARTNSQSTRGGARSGNVAADKAAIAWGMSDMVVRWCVVWRKARQGSSGA